MTQPDASTIRAAARAIGAADALLIGAGAGMGVDSGLPDFRGPEGFWRAYPPYARLGLSFAEVANPRHFANDPTFGWGFYGHRFHLYRATRPHDGFAILRKWADRMGGGAFVFTSNVDDHFRRAGFDPDRVAECHGSIEFRQCLVDCGAGIFPAGPEEVAVDPDTFRAERPLPACPGCGGLARPNILMFGDARWDPARTEAQLGRFERWLNGLAGAKLVVIEFGAGRAIPTVRQTSEEVVEGLGGTLIRVNPREPAAPAGHLSIASGALATLRAIDQAVAGSGGHDLEDR